MTVRLKDITADLTVKAITGAVGHGFLTRLDLVIAVAAGNGQVLNFPVLHRGESDAGALLSLGTVLPPPLRFPLATSPSMVFAAPSRRRPTAL